MARVKGIMQVAGSLKGVSMYTIRGNEEVIMRTKGGPSKKTIATSDSCKALRKSGQEWSGCTKAASSIRRSIEPLTRVADYNVMGGLNALTKKIQCMDTEHEPGGRYVWISRNRSFLPGFDFNRTNPFDRVIRVSPTGQIDREAVSGTVTIPAFDPVRHLVAPNNLPLMRWVVTLGVATDVVMDAEKGGYTPVNTLLSGAHKEVCSEWYPVKRALPEQTIGTEMGEIAAKLTENDTLVLCIGVEFGTLDTNGEGEAVKYAGCGKTIEAG
jgi:hypothetical protein